MLSRITNIGLRRPLYRSNATTRVFNNGSKRFNTTKANQSSSSSSSQQSGSSGTNGKKKTGIKALIQEYGYSALAVYLGLSCIDFPLCFIGVHSVGEDKIHEYQDKFKKMIGITPKERPPKVEGEENKEDEPSSIWSSTLFTEAILAYGIHKSLIFIRLPITAAITPAIVGKLRKMGFNIGSQKLSTLAQQAKVKTSQKIVDSRNAVASNKKFGTPVTKRQKWWSWFF